jgi:alginate O-acetyltransferase complex protein AlgI
MITMLLGGLWHGANWTFVVWGGLHGLFLVVNHGWSALMRRLAMDEARPSWLGNFLTGALTFLCVVLSWVFFRAESIGTAWRLIEEMFDFRGAIALIGSAAAFADFFPTMMVPPNSGMYVFLMFSFGLAAVWLSPNSQELISLGKISITRFKYWVIGANLFTIGLLSVINFSRGSSEFIYFNF